MSCNRNELDKERLGTTNPDGSRIYLYPDDVKGKWVKYRSVVYYFLIVLYLVLPWTKMGGEQTFLIDIVNREYFFFGNLFYAHDVPLLFIVLLFFIILIGVLTAVLGRVWCGWACPQTVFIEAIFRKIEAFAEGNPRKRRRLDEGPMSIEKALRKTFKWFLFVVMSLIISHSFLAYFVRVEELLKIIQISPSENYNLFTTMLFITAVFLLDFGWFREQFCIIACPYGRLQSVLLDPDSLIVGYDYNRGEPRKTPGDTEFADCVNCYKCVNVCPTGIDIRRGTQLECINCTRCIDVCDEVMEHVGKPTGLIRYTTERELEEGAGKTKFLRPRVIFYTVFLILLGTIGSYLITQSKNVQVLFMRATKSPYQVVQVKGEERIVNYYKLELFYRDTKTLHLSFKADSDEVEIVTPKKDLTLEATRKTLIPLFFKFKRGALNTEGSKVINVSIYNGEEELVTKEITLVGPFK